jgi:hypothetical protein
VVHTGYRPEPTIAEIQAFLRQPQQILARLRQRVKLSEVERQQREQESGDQRAQRRDKGARGTVLSNSLLEC